MTRDDIIRMAREAGWEMAVLNEWDAYEGFLQRLERFHAIAVAAEREACAKVCEQRKIITPEWQLDQHYNQGASHCAAAIRARGET